MHVTPSTSADVNSEECKEENSITDVTSIIKTNIELEKSEMEDAQYSPRITSPTYGILQNTVTQLITISEASFDQPIDSITINGSRNLSVPSCPYSNSPDRTAYKTPPESSIVSTPGFFTPQSTTSDFKKSSDTSSSTSSTFQTPLNISPSGTNDNSNKSLSLTSTSYKTALDTLTNSSQSSIFNTPCSKNKTHPPNVMDIISDEVSTYVGDLNTNTQNALYVKPVNIIFDRNRTMLSILMDSPRDQNGDNILPSVHSTVSNLSITKGSEKKQVLNSSETLPSSNPDQVSSISALSPDSAATLSRGPSRRRLQRSLVRISSQTPLELVELR